MQTSSPDITSLDVSVLMDLSLGGQPTLTLQNASVMPNAGNLKWAFEIYAPSGTTVYKGQLATPDITGLWNTPFTRNSGFPLPFGLPETGNYQVVVNVQDSLAKVFTLTKTLTICKPSGWTKETKNFFGAALHSIITKCQTAQLFCEDITNYSYQGVVGTAVQKLLQLRMPTDDTGNEPAPFVVNNFASALVPITTSGAGYQAFQTSIYLYDLGNNCQVKIKYIGRSTFAVHCNLDLGSLGCAIAGLVDDIQNGTCADMEAARAKLDLINPKFSLALTGILYPQMCVDPWALVEEIKTIGGFDCDCCSSGINAGIALSGSGPLGFQLVAGGDVNGTFNIVGSTVQLTLQDLSYVFKLNDDYTGEGFLITAATQGNTRTITLKVDQALLAQDLLNTIQSNTGLLNQLVSLTTQNQDKIQVDSKCLSDLIGGSQDVCDYVFSLDTLGHSIVIQSVAAGQLWPLNFLFDGTNAAALQTALNALNVGTFTVAYNAGTHVLSATTLANAYKVGGILARDGAALKPFGMMTSNCMAGTKEFTQQVLFQALIDYICSLGSHTIQMGRSFDIHTLVAIAGKVTSQSTSAEDSAASVVNLLITAYNKLVDVVQAVKEVNAPNVANLFAGNAPTTMTPADLFYGRFNGAPGQITLDAVIDELLVKLSGSRQTDFCKVVSMCNQSACGAVQNATMSYDSTTKTLTMTITNTGALKYRCAYKSYYPNQFGGNFGLEVGTQDVVASAGATTIATWNNVQPYSFIGTVIALCPSGASTKYVTNPSSSCLPPGSFSVVQSGSNFVATWGSIPAGSTKVRLERIDPNGSKTAANYDSAASPLSIPIPSGLYGDIQFNLYTVCDEVQGWYSAALGPVTVPVDKPNSCPRMIDASITQLTPTSIQVTGTKPSSSLVPNAYTLNIYPQGGGAKISSTLNSGGSTVVWNLAVGLAPNDIYSWEIVSECQSGRSDPFAGGMFVTPPNSANNSQITNASPTTDVVQPLQISVDSNLVYLRQAGLNHGTTDSFVLPQYTSVTVRVKACGMILSTASIVSNGVTFTPAYIDSDGSAVFNNVNIFNGAQFSFSN